MLASSRQHVSSAAALSVTDMNSRAVLVLGDRLAGGSQDLLLLLLLLLLLQCSC
jgi:hypothetical protein